MTDIFSKAFDYSFSYPVISYEERYFVPAPKSYYPSTRQITKEIYWYGHSETWNCDEPLKRVDNAHFVAVSCWANENEPQESILANLKYFIDLVTEPKNYRVAHRTENAVVKNIPKVFLPSEALARLVIESYTDLLGAANGSIDLSAEVDASDIQAFENAPSINDVCNLVSVRLQRMLATLGFRARAKRQQAMEITSDDRFAVEVQHEILSRLYLSPDRCAKFFQLLKKELIEYLVIGGTMGGDWGRIIEKDNELVLQLNFDRLDSNANNYPKADFFKRDVGKI